MSSTHLNLRINKIVHHYARTCANAEGKTLVALVNDAVIDYLLRNTQFLDITASELEDKIKNQISPFDETFNPWGRETAKIRNKGWARPNRHSLPAPIPENIKHPYGSDD